MAGRIWVMDREAYVERRAIMEVEGVDSLTAARDASDSGYRTRMSKAATEAANGDWEPAREWVAEIAKRFRNPRKHYRFNFICHRFELLWFSPVTIARLGLSVSRRRQ